MKRIFKVLGYTFLALVLLGMIGYLVLDKPLPKSTPSPEADTLAKKMQTALNYTAFTEAETISWSFPGNHHYVWYKEKGQVEVRWDDYEVLLYPASPGRSSVWKSKDPITEIDGKRELINKALTFFNNDSFWLLAPFKVFDPGTTRALVDLDDGSKGLLVHYSAGGDTPGDSYLWILDENHFPKAYRMWVNIIPIGGLEASWDGWVKTEAGFYVPQSHKLGFMSIDMGQPKAY
jgi:hypothetical protein